MSIGNGGSTLKKAVVFKGQSPLKSVSSRRPPTSQNRKSMSSNKYGTGSKSS